MDAPELNKFVPKAPKPEGFDDEWRPVRVLVVDDEIIVRRLLSQVLKSAGYEIVGEAGDGSRAVDLYKMLHPDIVTMDVEMPFMDGFAALEQILRVNPKAVVVMLTNQKEKYTVARIIKAGAREYIVKPIKRNLILEKLRRVRGIKD
jgi:two-component system, chemotaxis family, chemotaxis protein CheY